MAIILPFHGLQFSLKEEIKEKIIEILQKAENHQIKVYISTLNRALAQTNVYINRLLIIEAVEELQDDGYIFVENLFASIRLTDKKFKKRTPLTESLNR